MAVIALIFSLMTILGDVGISDMFPDKAQIPKADQGMMKIMDKTIGTIEKKYHISQIGFGRLFKR